MMQLIWSDTHLIGFSCVRKLLLASFLHLWKMNEQCYDTFSCLNVKVCDEPSEFCIYMYSSIEVFLLCKGYLYFATAAFFHLVLCPRINMHLSVATV